MREVHAAALLRHELHPSPRAYETGHGIRDTPWPWWRRGAAGRATTSSAAPAPNESRRTVTFQGPLRLHASNPRYFTDDGGRAVYLTGSHTWASLQDLVFDGVGALDYEAYLDFMEAHHHNFMRMWMWEQAEGGSGLLDRIVI